MKYFIRPFFSSYVLIFLPILRAVLITTLLEFPITHSSEALVSCSNCKACCCRLEVMLISDTGVPLEHIAVDHWGGETMLRLDDGWCSALDRTTYKCSIYENRPDICRDFEMASYECKTERLILGVSQLD